MSRLSVLPAPEGPDPRVALNRTAFEKLLSWLGPDRERAGQAYERIRCRLVKLFECRGCRDPEELADVTIDRVGRRIAEGEEIRTSDPAGYFYGVARNVLREAWRRRRLEDQARGVSEAMLAWDDPGRAESPPISQRKLDCLERCLEALPPDERELILAYYRRGDRVLVQARRELAERLGLPLNALRVRAHRIRSRLEGCVRRRLAAAEDAAPRRGAVRLSREDE
jgi:RNA polymerase sigma factor (sigma-70 family)